MDLPPPPCLTAEQVVSPFSNNRGVVYVISSIWKGVGMHGGSERCYLFVIYIDVMICII